ncbi:MAG: hypothetical protein ACEQSH_00585 [Bacteroidia bacterium]
MTAIRLTLFGRVASKANSRKVATIAGRLSIIKSAEALQFEREALQQIPPACRVQLEGPVAVSMWIYYDSERPDLDESLVLDILQNRWMTPKDKATKKAIGPRQLVQKGVYANDRQVREKHVYHGIDKANPRVVIEVKPMGPQQPALFDLPSAARPTAKPATVDNFDCTF